MYLILIGGTMNFGEALITNTEYMKLPTGIEAIHFMGGLGGTKKHVYLAHAQYHRHILQEVRYITNSTIVLASLHKVC